MTILLIDDILSLDATSINNGGYPEKMMSCVKGTGVLAVYEYLSKIEGPEGLEKVRRSLSSDDQKTFSEPILPISWVDFGFYMRMIVTADAVLGRGDYQIVEEAARYNMSANFGTLYKALISLANPRFAFKRSNLAWRRFFDHGTLTSQWFGPKECTLTLTDFPDLPIHHEYNLTPSIDEITRISGGKNTSCVHEKCALKGHHGCVWRVKWR